MGTSILLAAARPAAILTAVVLALAGPAVALAHGLAPAYQSPLPLAIYLAGAAGVVALSFVFVIAHDLRATAPPAPRRIRVPAAVRVALRVIGIAGWGWIMAQGIAGGSSDAAVAGLLLWVYGWVGIAMLSALVFPVWEWVDPFATLFDVGAWILRRGGVRGWAPSGLPDRLRVWPATAGFAFFVWLELVLEPGTAALTLVLAAYTLLTLVLMAQVGRDAWRAGGETFSVWFRTLNRLAPYGLAPVAERSGRNGQDGAGNPGAPLDPDAVDSTAVLRRGFATGLLETDWRPARIVLVALGVASIIFDGVSQTVAFGSVFGAPGTAAKTVELIVFLAVVVGAALVVARALSPSAIGAGLLPIAVGYLVAHYLTFLLFDGQRIVVAMSDPLQSGADLFGTAFFQVQTGWLPPGLVWTAQLAAVVGGHMLGAWGGHVSAQRDAEVVARAKPPRDLRHRKIRTATGPAPESVRVREVPLALVMVALSTLTLWSLGQAIVKEEPTARVTPWRVEPLGAQDPTAPRVAARSAPTR